MAGAGEGKVLAVDDDDSPQSTPSAVVAAVALGVAPLPFLAVYAVLFILHGSVHPVVPPDITDSKTGELVAGLIALALFMIGVVSIYWYMNQRRRWLFALGQLATLATSIDFTVDSTKGSLLVPVLLVATSAVALVISLLPVSANFVHSRVRLPVPARRRRAANSETPA